MNKIKEKIAEHERLLKLTENTAQHHWAMWKVLREQTSDLIAEIEQLKKKEAHHEP